MRLILQNPDLLGHTGIQKGRQADGQTDRRTGRHTSRQANWLGRQADGQTCRRTDRQADMQTDQQAITQARRQQADMQRDRQQADMQTTCRRTDRQSYRRAYMQTGRQAGRQPPTTVDILWFKHWRAGATRDAQLVPPWDAEQTVCKFREQRHLGPRQLSSLRAAHEGVQIELDPSVQPAIDLRLERWSVQSCNLA